MTTEKLWINLGCGDDIKQGYVNVDKFMPEQTYSPFYEAFPCDLELEWPWEDSTVDYIVAYDIIEHLKDKIHTMNEAWRVLKPGGILEICVPTTEGPGAFQDPTHVSFWNLRSFLYYEAGNPYRERFAQAYGITAKFKIISASTQQTVDGPKLTIILEAVK